MKKLIVPAPSPLAGAFGIIAAVFGALYARQKAFDVVDTLQRTFDTEPEPKHDQPQQ